MKSFKLILISTLSITALSCTSEQLKKVDAQLAPTTRVVTDVVTVAAPVTPSPVREIMEGAAVLIGLGYGIFSTYQKSVAQGEKNDLQGKIATVDAALAPIVSKSPGAKNELLQTLNDDHLELIPATMTSSSPSKEV